MIGWGLGWKSECFQVAVHAQEGHGTPLSTIGFWGGALRLQEVCYIGLLSSDLSSFVVTFATLRSAAGSFPSQARIPSART